MPTSVKNFEWVVTAPVSTPLKYETSWPVVVVVLMAKQLVVITEGKLIP